MNSGPKIPDLRTFLEDYEERNPADVVRITRPIKSRYETTAIAAQLEQMKRTPVLIFENVVNDDGRPFKYPLLSFLCASRERMAYAVGADPKHLASFCAERKQRRIKPQVVSREAAPVKEVVKKGDEVDLLEFPVPVFHSKEPGPYITAGFITCYQREGGTDNSSIQRGWISGRNEIRFWLAPGTHNYNILREHEENGEDMPMAIWIGHHPAVIAGMNFGNEYGRSHYETAGGFIGQPLSLVPSETLGESFLVPSHAEIVIEGVHKCGLRKPEGPFGEFPRTLGEQRFNPVMEVTAVTHRRNPYWYGLVCGHVHWLTALLREAEAFERVGKSVAGLANVYAPMSGCGQLTLYLQIHKRSEGEGKAALLPALGIRSVKHVFVFDDDVNIFDETEVLWAMATRVQADKDVLIVTNCLGSPLDPSSPGTGYLTKMGIDCTRPLPRSKFPEVLSVPHAVIESTPVSNYISQEKLEKVPVDPFCASISSRKEDPEAGDVTCIGCGCAFPVSSEFTRLAKSYVHCPTCGKEFSIFGKSL